ncbi:MAG: helix-turn-helix domain-containing protein [Nitrospinae bacterium]|nr:helix-turn-helix domain-containing protein [Nitrospinota bacterium]
MAKRNLFKELKQGIEEIKAHRQGKITLRHYEVKKTAHPNVTAEAIRETRENLNLSRGVFARQLGVSPRTLEKWEQGAAKPNDPAATLILLVRKYPDTLTRLSKLFAEGH